MKVIQANAFKFFAAVIFIGVLAAGWLSFQRFQVESRAQTVEMVYDYSNILDSAVLENQPVDQISAVYKKSGITSLAVYDETPEKLVNRNLIKVYTGTEFSLYHPDIVNIAPDHVFVGKTANADSEAYFRETVDHVKLLFPESSYRLLTVGNDTVLELMTRRDKFMSMPLGIYQNTVKDAAEMGFYVVLRPLNIPHIQKEDLTLFYNAVNASDKVSAVVFQGKEAFGFKDQLQTVADFLKGKNIPVVLIEAQSQLGFEKQAGALDLVKMMDYDTVRLYAMSKDELIKLDPTEAASRFYISDIERNIRMNLFPSYKFAAEGMTLSETNAEYIGKVTERLQGHGFNVGKASVMEPYFPNRELRAVAVMGAYTLCVVCLLILIPALKKYILGIWGAGLIGAEAVYFMTGATLLLQLLALGTAVCMPVVIVTGFLNYCIRRKNTAFVDIGWGKLLSESLMILWGAGILSLVGASFISALLGDIRFLLEIEFFRGVKVTFILPVILITIVYIQKFPFFGKTVASDRDFVGFVRNFCNIQIKLGLLACLGLLAVVGYMFVGRSGNNGAPVPAFEITLRRMLENLMYARPREKEFLFGHPAILVSLFALYQKWPQILHYLLILAVTIGQGSMVETFAHMRSPFILSFIRGLDGLAAGSLSVIAALIGVMILARITKFFGDRYEQI